MGAPVPLTKLEKQQIIDVAYAFKQLGEAAGAIGIMYNANNFKKSNGCECVYEEFEDGTKALIKLGECCSNGKRIIAPKGAFKCVNCSGNELKNNKCEYCGTTYR